MDELLVRDILAVVHSRTGVDFSRYRKGTVRRRIQNRMIALGTEDPRVYFAHLHAREDETPRLIERLSIKVSRFYRNHATFELIRREVLPNLVSIRQGMPLRIWSAGCGFGEEPFTLAMLLEEADIAGSVVATDIDATALDRAAVGRYVPESLTEIPDDLSTRYFNAISTSRGPVYEVREDVRRRVSFVQHDLTSQSEPPAGAPFDLVTCRNVLIYFGPEAQQHALETLLDSLEPEGVLCLGEAEWPRSSIASRLDPIDKRCRLFRVTTLPPEVRHEAA